jgi:hypothetical protein
LAPALASAGPSLRFAREGYPITLLARSGDHLDALATEVARSGRRLSPQRRMLPNRCGWPTPSGG